MKITLRKSDFTVLAKVPITRRVSLFGVPGFAVHRCYGHCGGWKVSHISTGGFVPASCEETQRLAFQSAQNFALRRAEELGVTPRQVIQWAIKRVRKTKSLGK